MTTTAPQGRLILWYCLAIGSVGAMHPFLSLVLTRRGASEQAVMLMLALFPLGLMLATPVWGLLADRSDAPARIIAAALALATLGAAATLLPGGHLVLLPGLALLAVSRSGAISLTDVHTIAALGGGEAGRSAYGRVRMWGSIAFIAAVQGVGLLAERWPRAPLLVNFACLAALMAVTLSLPSAQERPTSRPRASLAPLLREPRLMRLFAVSALHVAAMSSYDNLFALHGASRGLSDGMIGAAVGLGVAAEVLVLFASPLLLRRWSPATLMVIAVLAAIPRWWITGTSASDTVLVLTQAAHGLTFGLWWVGGVAFVSTHAPSHLRASAQAGFVASGFGVGNLCALLVATYALPRLGTGLWFQGLAGVSLVAALLLPWALRTSSGGDA